MTPAAYVVFQIVVRGHLCVGCSVIILLRLMRHVIDISCVLVAVPLSTRHLPRSMTVSDGGAI